MFISAKWHVYYQDNQPSFWLGLNSTPQEEIDNPKAMLWEFTHFKYESNAVILLNGNNFKMTPKFIFIPTVQYSSQTPKEKIL